MNYSLWSWIFNNCFFTFPATRTICGIPILLSFSLFTSGQVKDRMVSYEKSNYYNEVSRFYQLNSYQFVWINDQNVQKDLWDMLNMADSFGLDPDSYRYPFFKTYMPGQVLKNMDDSVDADIHLTEAAIHFFTDLKYGNKTPVFSYSGLKYNPLANSEVPSQLARHIRERSLKDLVAEIQPGAVEYKEMLNKLSWFRRIINDVHFKDARIVSRAVDQTNKPLLVRLYQLVITDSVLTTADKKTIMDLVQKAQRLFDLLNDGVLGSTALDAFNIPLNQRMKEVKNALNYLRWTETIRQTSSVLLLNIPSAYLMVYSQGKVVLDSKVVVGKPSTPTPTVTSTITAVVLYPFWNVPYKIATRELLPRIKRDIGFLDAGNYEVLNSEGRVVDPHKINWKNLSADNFPYRIRQSTGCDNSLGIVKFEFYNPFSVYLHDTPYKGFFSLNKRYLSHGCMRVENYLELAHLLLGRNRIAIDTLTAKGCLFQQAPKSVRPENGLPVMILYSTAWYNKDGEVRFYDDVYRKLNR